MCKPVERQEDVTDSKEARLATLKVADRWRRANCKVLVLNHGAVCADTRLGPCEKERVCFTVPVCLMDKSSWQQNICELREDIKMW